MTETIHADEPFKDKYLDRIPLDYWAQPEEIALGVEVESGLGNSLRMTASSTRCRRFPSETPIPLHPK